MLAILIAMLGAVAAASAGAQASTLAALRPLAIADAVGAASFHQWGRLAVIAPDGESVAYTVCDPRRITLDTITVHNRSATRNAAVESMGCDVWVSAIHDGTGRNLTSNAGNNWGPAWSPDGHLLAFYSDRDGAPRLWVWERASGQTRRLADAVTRTRVGWQVPQWSQDGRRVMVKLFPEGMTQDQVDAPPPVPAGSRSTAAKEPGSTATIYRSGDQSDAPHHGLDTAETLPPNNSELADLALIDVATGAVRRVVRRSRVAGYWFSPDRTRIAYTEYRGDLAAIPVTYQASFALKVVDIEGNGDRTIVSAFPQHHGTSVSWSPDGTQIAYIAGADFDTGDCYVIAATGGSPRKLNGAPAIFNTEYVPPLWDSQGDAVYLVGNGRLWRGALANDHITAITPPPVPGVGMRYGHIIATNDGDRVWSPDGGRVSVYATARDARTRREGFARLDVTTGAVTTVLERDQWLGHLFTPPVGSPDGRRVVYRSESASEAPDLWVTDDGFAHARRLTHINPRFDTYVFGKSRLLDFRSADGDLLHGALLLPAGYEPGKRYPMVVWEYASDSGSRGVNIFGLWIYPYQYNMQVLATRGYAVLWPDIPVHLRTPMQDILKAVMPAVDRAVAEGIADPDRLAVMGQSFGGYSTLATIAQTTRFKAAVMNAGIGDLIASYGSMELGTGVGMWIQFLEAGAEPFSAAMGAPPWVVPQAYVQNSPIFFLDRVETPLVIQAGAADANIVPYSDEVFVGLKRLGKDVTYLRYAGEGHTLEQYPNLIDYWRRVLTFLDSHLGAQSSPPHLFPP